jgi:cobalt-precorrin-5B (C1)-methyltransferase
MVGKIAKLAAGVMMTHYRRSKIDGDLMAELARRAGASDEVVASATDTATARHFFETCVAHNEIEPLRLLCEQAAARCREHVDGAMDVEVVMVDFDGDQVVARA